MMKAFLDHIPQEERLVIIEQPAELKVMHPNAVRWEAVEAIPGQVAITPSDLLAQRSVIVPTGSSWAKFAMSAATTCFKP